MAISTYTDLQTQIAKWLKGSDLSDQTDTLIGLVENNLNRQLRTPQMEIVTTISSDTGNVPMPGDFLQLKSLSIGKQAPLKQVDINDYQQFYNSDHRGDPKVFAIVGLTAYIAPYRSDSTDYTVTYWQQIPPLTADNPTNWLLSASSDIYFFGSLAFAEAFGWNDERIPLFKAAFDEAVDALKVSAVKMRYGAGPLVPQAPVTDVTYRGDAYKRAGYIDFGLLNDDGDYLLNG